MKDIIFWLDTVPVCCKGVFDAVAELWDGNTYYVCSGELDSNRQMIAKDGSENDIAMGAAKYVFLSEKGEDREIFLNAFIDEHLNAIHVFNGYRGPVIDRVLAKVNTPEHSAKTIVWAERPCPPKLKGTYPFAFFHAAFALKYRKKIDAMLPLGELGVKSYASYGWPKDKLYPFLYLPVMNEGLSKKPVRMAGGPIRFIYLGRFTKGSKGTDVLMRAVDMLGPGNYTVDLVGGYGDLLDETMEWVERTQNVSFGGTWPIEEACDRLRGYDVCVVPSKYEGWNVTVNEALMAGIGCICTDECVSDEMVVASKAGSVVQAGNSRALATAMKDVVDHPNLVDEWVENAYKFRGHMTAVSAAQYFLDVVRWVGGERGCERPNLPPWQSAM